MIGKKIAELNEEYHNADRNFESLKEEDGAHSLLTTLTETKKKLNAELVEQKKKQAEQKARIAQLQKELEELTRI